MLAAPGDPAHPDDVPVCVANAVRRRTGTATQTIGGRLSIVRARGTSTRSPPARLTHSGDHRGRPVRPPSRVARRRTGAGGTDERAVLAASADAELDGPPAADVLRCRQSAVVAVRRQQVPGRRLGLDPPAPRLHVDQQQQPAWLVRHRHGVAVQSGRSTSPSSLGGEAVHARQRGRAGGVWLELAEVERRATSRGAWVEEPG